MLTDKLDPKQSDSMLSFRFSPADYRPRGGAWGLAVSPPLSCTFPANTSQEGTPRNTPGADRLPGSLSIYGVLSQKLLL